MLLTFKRCVKNAHANTTQFELQSSSSVYVHPNFGQFYVCYSTGGNHSQRKLFLHYEYIPPICTILEIYYRNPFLPYKHFPPVFTVEVINCTEESPFSPRNIFRQSFGRLAEQYPVEVFLEDIARWAAQYCAYSGM